METPQLITNDSEFDECWLTSNEWLKLFSIYIYCVVGKVKASKSTYIQVSQYYEEDLVAKEMVPSSIEIPEVIENLIYGNHATVGQAKNDSFNNNIQ